MGQSDEALMQRISEGDEPAFEALMERYQEPVRQQLLRMLRDETAAERPGHLRRLRELQAEKGDFQSLLALPVASFEGKTMCGPEAFKSLAVSWLVGPTVLTGRLGDTESWL
ncbi:MAG: hypothetical protein GXY55_00440 [Phycisphaerae bacterium]|nr:hypothetical protein [Phycisphaerae bacterium]